MQGRREEEKAEGGILRKSRISEKNFLRNRKIGESSSVIFESRRGYPPIPPPGRAATADMELSLTHLAKNRSKKARF